MTKQEIEQAIENGKSVWYIFGKSNKIIKVDTDRIDFLDNGIVRFSYENLGEIKGYQQYLSIDGKTKCFFKTKAEAEHYLHHANVTRTETLPFLTWEEFLEKEHIEFFNGGKGFTLYISYAHNENIRIITFSRYNPDGNVLFDLPKTEENFYKAYDECVRLFKGGEE